MSHNWRSSSAYRIGEKLDTRSGSTTRYEIRNRRRENCRIDWRNRIQWWRRVVWWHGQQITTQQTVCSRLERSRRNRVYKRKQKSFASWKVSRRTWCTVHDVHNVHNVLSTHRTRRAPVGDSAHDMRGILIVLVGVSFWSQILLKMYLLWALTWFKPKNWTGIVLKGETEVQQFGDFWKSPQWTKSQS
jgi:hypothetical protein